MHSCQQKISVFLERHGIQNTKIVIALSGGPDSVALLRLLQMQAAVRSLTLTAAHVNYNLRGADSMADQEFCRELCRELGVKLYTKRAGKRPATGNVQKWAREIRYRFFHNLMSRYEIPYLALGHNRDDNVETILMALARGSGTFGLSGMAEASDGLLRPLLACPRAEIEDFLASSEYDYRTDKSNLEEKYLRNKVRKRLVPVMRELFGEAVDQNIHRAGAIFAEHESYARQIAQKELDKIASITAFGKFVLDLSRFRKYHPFIARVALALCYERLRGSLSGFEYAATERVFTLLERGSGETDLTGGVKAELCGSRLYLFTECQAPIPVQVAIPGETPLAAYGLRLSAEFVDSKPSARSLRSGENRRVYLDADSLPPGLGIRSRRRGDRFTHLGVDGSKTLSDFFTDRKVDRPLRDEIPILCASRQKRADGARAIAWVVGYEISDYFKVTERTKRIVKLEVVPYRGV